MCHRIIDFADCIENYLIFAVAQIQFDAELMEILLQKLQMMISNLIQHREIVAFCGILAHVEFNVVPQIAFQFQIVDSHLIDERCATWHVVRITANDHINHTEENHVNETETIHSEVSLQKLTQSRPTALIDRLIKLTTFDGNVELVSAVNFGRRKIESRHCLATIIAKRANGSGHRASHLHF